VSQKQRFAALGAAWTTLSIATLGSLLAPLLALPLGLLAARNLGAPALVAWLAKGVLNVVRSIHTLVFGLIWVGVMGLGAVGMRGRADERADRLSGGEGQKVATARMLMQGPCLILADEPTASLDGLVAAGELGTRC
jgi:ABC-type amino acid transport system permease subunit